MTTADALRVLGAASWTDEGFYLKEFAHKNKFPKMVRVVKGSYLNLGVSSLSNPSLHQHILLVNLGKKKRLLAQCLKFKDNRKITTVGAKISIPASYDGYFEILSEDGRSVRCIESVAELCKRFPDSVLVRESFKAYISKGDDLDAIKHKSRVIHEGETLILVGEVGVGTSGSSSSSSSTGSNSLNSVGSTGNNKPRSSPSGTRFLRCFDCNGENVYLPYEQSGKFSAIAKEENISGVHSASNLMNKRLPIMARLAAGQTPPFGIKQSNSSFVPEMRLLSAVDEDFLVGLVLSSKDCQIVPVPLSALLKVQTLSNAETVEAMSEFSRLVDRCTEMSTDLTEQMTLYDVAGLAKDLRLHGVDKTIFMNNMANQKRMKHPRRPTTAGHVEGGKGEKRDEYDEIEQIYDYVRGFAPLPKSAKGWRYEPVRRESIYQTPTTPTSPTSNTPPEPPPIETIPTRMNQQSPMEFATPPDTPPVSSVWDINRETVREGKKRVRPKFNDENAVVGGHHHHHPHPPHHHQGTMINRFLKASMGHRPNTAGGGSAHKHKLFKYRLGRGGGGGGEPVRSMTLSRSNLYSPLPDGCHGPNKSSSPPSFFQLRYKSLTNLTQAEYDTLDSSNSGGGKTSTGDSAGSRTLPPSEKRSRRLSRPKSLTNLVWGGSRANLAPPTPQSVTPSTPAHSKSFHSSHQIYAAQRQPSILVHHHSNKLGSLKSSKKIGTLYL